MDREIMPLNNFGLSSTGVYRGAQPDEDGLRYLASIGIKHILKLNTEFSDWETAEDYGISVIYRPMPTLFNPVALVTDIANLIGVPKRPRPTWYVHCEHGRDRTGLIVAAFGLLHCGQTLEQVQAERKLYGVAGLDALADELGGMDLVLRNIAERKIV